MTKLIRVFIFLVLILIFTGECVLYAGVKAPSFNLPEWGTEKLVSLDDFKGKIVVLDFFNANCVKCFRASWEIQIDIQEYYTENSGNPHGIEVQVVAVNSEVAEHEDINVFLQDTELDLVLDDSEGNLLKRFDGTTVPYIAVIDATAIEFDSTASNVVYQSEYEGSKKLRTIIDAINGQAVSVPSNSVKSVNRTTESSLSSPVEKSTHETAIDIATLIASDAFVTDTLIQYQQKRPSMEFSLAISYGHIDIEYVSEYLDIRRECDLTAERIGVRGSASFDLNDSLTLTAGGGIYDGFQTYRALWLDEFYLHMFDAMSEYVDDLEGYEKANPWGYNVSSGLRWEYMPYTGFAEVNISFQHDIVSPGYEAGIPVVRLRDAYDTISGHLAFENVVTRRLRTLVECRIDDTT
ncbi:MAG: TlpA disulfide reductase family protein, partial [Desulfobacteraceae bacterium]